MLPKLGEFGKLEAAVILLVLLVLCLAGLFWVIDKIDKLVN